MQVFYSTAVSYTLVIDILVVPSNKAMVLHGQCGTKIAQQLLPLQDGVWQGSALQSRVQSFLICYIK